MNDWETPLVTPPHPQALVLELCHDLGFHHVRVGRVGRTPHHDRYKDWIEAGHHGAMSYLERNMDIREHPAIRLENAASVLALGVGYPSTPPPDPGGRTGRVARYAWGRDYHNLVGKRIKKLKKRLREEGIGSWGGIDTAPILERAWAEATGLGVTGKSCVQFLPGSSSYLFLAVLFVDVELEPDLPIVRDHCGSCTQCLVGCPTQAYHGPWQLDARKCVSYWTIEAPGLPPRTLRPGFRRWFFGCDVCQEVCPHNHDPPGVDEPDLQPRNAWVDLDEVLATPDPVLMDRYIGTPLRRPKAHGLKRNAAIVLGNLGDEGAVPVLVTHGLTHPNPIVRGASVWALKQLEGLPSSYTDTDAVVVDELRAEDS